jgi:putative ABC transport system permease protein
LASRPARSFTAALGIGVGIATVLSVQVIDRNTIRTQQRLHEENSLSRYDVELSPVKPGVPDGGAAPHDFAADPDLAAFCGWFYDPATLTRAGAPPEEVSVFAVGPNASADFGAYLVEEGHDFSSATADELLLPEKVSVERGLKVGDHVTLERTVPVREGCRDGKLVRLGPEGEQAKPATPVSFTVVGVLAPSRVGAQPLFVVPFESGARLFRDAHVQPAWWGRLARNAVEDDLAKRLKERWIVEKPRHAMAGERIDQKAFRKSLGVTSCLALLLGLFVIYNAFSMALVERVREIGLLRALGLTRGEIVKAVLLEGLMLATIGAAIGLVLSAALVAFMVKAGITTLGSGKPLQITEVPWTIVGAVVALGTLFALFGMTAPLLRARHLSVVEALRAGRLALRSDPGFSLRVGLLLGIPVTIPLLFVIVRPPLGERQTEANALILELAGVTAAFFVLLLVFAGPIHRLVEWVVARLSFAGSIESRLAASAVRGARQRVLATLTGLAVVVACVFVVRSVNDGFLDEQGRFADASLGGRVYVARDYRKTQAESELRVEGVARVYDLAAEVHAPWWLRAMNAEDVRANRDRAGLNDADLDSFTRGEGIVLSRFLAEQYGWKRGDPVTLSTFSGAKEFRVVGVTDAIGYWPDDRSFAVIEMGRMDELFCVNDARGKEHVVELEPGADERKVESALLERIAPAQRDVVRSAATIKAFYLADGRRDFYVFDVILFCTAALAGVGLLNSLTIALLERRREIGLLRTIGVTARQVGRMLLMEALAIGLVAGLFAAALTAPVSRLVLDAVRIVSRLDLRWHFEPMRAALPLLATVGIAFVAALVPALRSGKLDLGALKRHE